MARVLLVDDDPLVLLVHELMLPDFGHEVISKCDAQNPPSHLSGQGQTLIL